MNYRFFISIILSMLITIPSFARELYHCSAEYDTVSKFTRYTTNAIGANFISKQVAKSIISKELKKSVKGDFNLKLKSFSAPDLTNGILQGFEFTANDAIINGVSIYKLEAESLCDFNYINYRKSPIEFKTQVPFSFLVLLRDTDLNKTFFSEEYKKQIKEVNAIFSDIFIIKDVYTEIKNNRLYFHLNTRLPIFQIPLRFTASSRISVENNDIELSGILVSGLSKFVSTDIIEQILNTINPLEFAIESAQIPHNNIIINKVKIIDNKIQINGIIVLGEKR